MKQLFKKENPIGYCLLPVLVFLVGKQAVYGLLMMAAAKIQAVSQEGAGVAVNGLADAVMIPVIWNWFLRRRAGEAGLPETEVLEGGQPVWSLFRNPAAGICQTLLLCLLGAAFCLAGNGLLQLTGLTGLFAEDYGSTMEVLYGDTLWAQIFWMVIAAPLAEELVYRRLLYGRMRQYCGFLKAAAGASLLFGLTHGFVLQGIYSFLLGMVLCFLLERYRALYPAVLVHMAANFCSVAATVCTPIRNWLSDRRNFGMAALISGVVCVLAIGYLVKTGPGFGIQDEGNIANKKPEREERK